MMLLFWIYIHHLRGL